MKAVELLILHPRIPRIPIPMFPTAPVLLYRMYLGFEWRIDRVLGIGTLTAGAISGLLCAEAV